VQRILIDAPNVDDNEIDKTIAITNENADELLAKINQIKR
jgi:hypothetical protein